MDTSRPAPADAVPPAVVAGSDATFFCVFSDIHRIASGDLPTVLRATKAFLDEDPTRTALIFDQTTGQQVDFDFSGTVNQVITRALPAAVRPGPGRPRLGVVCREVSLLPRHWDWLERQPQGCSAALRRLVDDARKRDPEGEARERARDAAGKFLWAVGGNLPDFEEATRALFASDFTRLCTLMDCWPTDVRTQVCLMLSLEP